MELADTSVESPNEAPESKREKAPLAIVGLLAIIFAPIIIATSILAGNTTSEKYSIEQQKEIRLLVTIKAQEFLSYSTANVCDGTGELSGLWKSEIQVRTDSWIRKTSLGQGTLNSEGACEYRISVTPPSELEGGKGIASATLPLGKTKDAIGDTGFRTSSKLIILTYKLG